MLHPSFPEEGESHESSQQDGTIATQQNFLLDTLLAQHRFAVQKILVKHCELASDSIVDLMMSFPKSVAGHGARADGEAYLPGHESMPARSPAGPPPGFVGPGGSVHAQVLGAPANQVQPADGNTPSWVAAPASKVSSTAAAANSTCPKNGGSMARQHATVHRAGRFSSAVHPADCMDQDTTEKEDLEMTCQESFSSAPVPNGKAKSYTVEFTDAGNEVNSHRVKLRRPAAVFVDVETIKTKLRQEMAKPPYHVAQFYYQSGWFPALATSPYFDSCTLFVIALNAIWIAVDIDMNDAAVLIDARPQFQIIDNIFCAYFTAELLVRFMSFRNKKDTIKDSWFVFDALMCMLMIFETWLVTIVVVVFDARASGAWGDASLLKGFRLVRMVRMGRIVRLLNAMPELMVLIKGMAIATRAVSCTIAVLIVIVYVFSITFRQLTNGTSLGDKYFNSVLSSMRLLILNGTVPDLADFALEIWDESVFYAAVFLVFMLLVTLTIMNMLIGVLVGVVKAVSFVEKEQLTIAFVKENLLEGLASVQGEGKTHEQISKDDFAQLLTRKDSIQAFNLMGVDVFGLVDLTDFIFRDQQELKFSDFMELIMQLRGTNQATVKDIVDLRKFIVNELKSRELVKPDTEAGNASKPNQGPDPNAHRTVDSTNIGSSFTFAPDPAPQAKKDWRSSSYTGTSSSHHGEIFSSF